MQQKQFAINTFFVFTAFAVNFLVGFFMSPYLVSRLGVVCYGFISLAGNLLAITHLLTVSFNSMSGRFLAIAIHKNDHSEANKLFNTVLFANLMLLLPLGILLGTAFVFRNSIFYIPESIAPMVANLFFMQITAFLLAMAMSNFGSVFFIRNRLDLQNLLVIFSKLFYVALILILFKLFSPSLTLVGVALLCPLAVDSLAKIILFRKFIPEIKIRLNLFNIGSLWMLMCSGVWNAVTLSARMCLFNLDVYFANIFINPLAAGTMAIAKIIPLQLDSFNAAVISLFNPTLTKNYAQKDQDSLKNQVVYAMRFNSFILQIPALAFAVYGDIFFKLWIPASDCKTIYTLACLALIPLFFSMPLAPLFSIQTVCNKLKVPALVLLASSLLVVICEIILLKFSSLGLLALAIPMAIISPLRNLTFTVIYAAKLMQLPWYYFLLRFFILILKAVVLLTIMLVFRYFYTPSSWITLIITGALSALFTWGIAFYLYFDSAERGIFWSIISSKIRKRFSPVVKRPE